MGYCEWTRLLVLAGMHSVYVSIYVPISTTLTDCTPLVLLYVPGPGACWLSIHCLDISISQVCPVRSDSLSVGRIYRGGDELWSKSLIKFLRCQVWAYPSLPPPPDELKASEKRRRGTKHGWDSGAKGGLPLCTSLQRRLSCLSTRSISVLVCVRAFCVGKGWFVLFPAVLFLSQVSAPVYKNKA